MTGAAAAARPMHALRQRGGRVGHRTRADTLSGRFSVRAGQGGRGRARPGASRSASAGTRRPGLAVLQGVPEAVVRRLAPQGVVAADPATVGLFEPLRFGRWLTDRSRKVRGFYGRSSDAIPSQSIAKMHIMPS